MNSQKYLSPCAMGEFVKQENDFIVFHGNLQQLLEKNGSFSIVNSQKHIESI
jgi:hypothetical protein